jgi:hypothetical protein
MLYYIGGESCPGFKLTNDLQHAGTVGVCSTSKDKSTNEELPNAVMSENEEGSDKGYSSSSDTDSTHSSCSYDSSNDVVDSHVSDHDSEQDSDQSDGNNSENDKIRYSKSALVAPDTVLQPKGSRAIERKDDNKKGKQRPPKDPADSSQTRKSKGKKAKK